MKKIYSLLLVALISVLSTTVWAETVSKEEALQLATNFFSTKMETGAVMRAPGSRTASTTLSQQNNRQTTMFQGKSVIVPPSNTTLGITAKSASLPTDQLVVSSDKLTPRVVELPKSLGIDQFYVIQNEGGQGWMLLAANDVVQPILAYSETGTFDPSGEMPDNLRYWLGMYNRQIKSALEGGQTASTEVASEWSKLRSGARRAKQATEVVSKLLTTTWNQGSPFYDQCPTYSGNGTSGQSVTGCVATAMAQVMNFWEWPNTGQGTKNARTSNYNGYTTSVPAYNFANTTFDWANMKDSYGSGYTNAQATAVATLMANVGAAVEMKYGPSSGAQTIRFPSSSTTYACAQNALWNYFGYNADSIKGYYRPGYTSQGYSSWSETNWKNMLKTELNKHRPIMYAGSDTEGAGHSFVCDGYRDDDYFHFNWGWGGRYDGYFTVNTLNPGTGGIGSGSGVYSEGQDVIIGIVPNVSETYKITYSVANGTLSGSSTWTQSTKGQSCTLPNVNPGANYRFLGWTDLQGSKTANCGKAGDSYTPMRNVTLYAVMIQKASLVYFVSDIEPGFVDHDVSWTSKPSWSGHGTCEVDSLYEDGEGTGVILPSVINDAGWTMQEWIIVYDGSLYIAGWPGDRFYPDQDTAYLYAYSTPNGKVYLDEELSGVVPTAGPFEDVTQTYGWIPQADGLTAKFVADENYQALTAGNTTVSVKVGGETVSNCYSFANNVLTITLTPAQMTEDIDIAITATVDPTWNCDDYSYTYTASQGTGTKTLNGKSWTISALTTNNGTASAQYDQAQRFGSNRNGSRCKSATYTTTGFNDCLIHDITIKAWTSYAGTIEAYINDSSLGSTATATATGTTTYTFTNTDNWQGAVKFVITNTNTNSSYIYVKSINVNMADYPDGSMEPADPIYVKRTYMGGGYYDYNEGEGTPFYVWQISLWNYVFTNGTPTAYGDEGYAYLALMAANSLTSIAGTYTPGYIYKCDVYNQKLRIVERYTGDNSLTFTYKSKGAGNYSDYYIYHVTGTWTDDNGQSYYMDDDVYTELANYDTEEDIIPTGDTNPKYYQVKHWQQKVDGGTAHNSTNYDLKETETGQGGENETFDTHAYSYNGFISPDDQSVTLTAANTQSNPAVVNYWYDRRKYPVVFLVDNIEVARDTIRYKATPSYSGPTPEREATNAYRYTFAGWTPVFAPITQATTYTAQFNAIPRYTVTFDVQGIGTAPESQIIDQGGKVTRPANPSATGYDFVNWYTDQTYNTVWNFNTVVTANMTLYAKWSAHTHSLTWNANGGVLSGNYTSGTVAYGTAITAPTSANISRTGYNFDGWTLDGTTVVTPAATMPDNALTYIAKWSPRTDIQYVVKHFQENIDDDNFTEVEADRQTLQGTMGQSYTPAVKSYTGFTAPATQTITIDGTGNQVITYNYTRNKHALTWNANGGTPIGSYTSGNQVKFGTPITAPQNVTRTGYTFAGWHNGTAIVTPATTMPDNDLTYTAQWNIKTYNLTFTSGNDKAGSVTVSPNKTTFNYNESVTITANTNTGYTFTGWSDGNTTNPRTITVNDATPTSIVARFASAEVQYIVHHMKQNIDNDEYTEQLPVDYETGKTDSLTAAVAFNYPGFDPVLPIEQQTIKADGTTEVSVYYTRKTYVIRFLVDGVEKQNETLRYQAPVSWKGGANPTKAATAQFTYTFTGWNPAIDENTVATQDQDYVAQFSQTTNTYTVSFNKQGHGGNTANQTIAYGSKVTEPADLSETGYTFGGWFKEEACNNAWDFENDVVTGNTVLYAKWTVNSHTLTWITDGDALTGNYTHGSVAYGTTIVAPNTPTKTGYTFKNWGADVPSTMPDNDLTFTAQWTANSNTKYVVKHLQQNLVGSDYTEFESENKTGTTAQLTAAVAKNYTGFTALAFSQATIAADGSTVVEIKYDRNVYTIKFVVEGVEVQSNDLRYGATPVYGGATPTKSATAQYTYTFSGWNPGIDVVTKAQTYTATFSQTVNKYTIVWKNEDGTVLETDENVPFGTTPTYDGATPTKAATAQYTFTHNGWTPAVASVTGDATYTATYSSTVNKYTVSFNANGHGTAPNSQLLEYGSKVTKPTDLVAEGYTFGGWFKQNGTAWDFNNDVVEGTLELVAKWTINSWTLTWDANGGTITSSNHTPAGLTVFGTALIAPVVELTGYVHMGWNPALSATMPDNDVTYKAVWAEAGDTHYTVKHLQQNLNDDNYTEITADEEDLTGATNSQTAAVAKNYTGFTALAFSQATIAADGSTVVEIKYDRNVYTIKFVVDGVEAQSDDLRYGATPVAPANPTKSADAHFTYTFDHWNPTVGVVEKAQTYEAVFSSTVNTYTIIWQNEDGTELEKDENVPYGTTPQYNGATPTKAATAQHTFTFASWTPAVVPVEGDATYTATYNSVVNEYTVSFNNNGHGTAPADQTIAFGSKVSKPEDLEETGYDFGGWFKEAACSNAWNFESDVIESDVELFAKWTVHTWTLNWDLNGGTIKTAGTPDGLTAFGTALTAPVVEKVGYEFDAWDPSVPATMPDKDATYKATWKAKSGIVVTVRHEKEQLNGDFALDVEEPLTGTTEEEVTPLVKNYGAGFKAPDAQTITIDGTGTQVITYQYKRNSFDLVWNANGGELSGEYSQGSLKFEAPINAPEDPIWEGHSFLGWDKDIPDEMPANNLTLTANWQIHTFTVSVTSESLIEGTVSVNLVQDKYEFGSSVEISAAANLGYHFTGWNDGNTESPRTIVIKSDTAFIAQFAANTNTQYTIRHLKETLEGGWEQDGTDEVRNDGVTAEWVTIEPNTYEGFKTPNAQNLQIAADGSTVFEYKYKRNSYSISWDANGGELSGDYSTEAKFEAQIAEPEISREGYNFLGWNIEVPATMPANALSFIAQWEAKVYNNVNIPSGQQEGGYVSVNPEEGPYSHDQEVTIIAVADEGYTFDGWSDGETASERVVVIAGDTTITAIFTPNNDTKFVIRRFIQNIEDDNFTFFDEEESQGTTGATVNPEPAAIVGFETPEVQSLVITGDGKAAVVYNYVRKSFNLVWDANGGNIISTDHTAGAVKFEAPITAAQVEFNGRIFKGWDPAEIPAKMPAEDLTFTAQWQKETFTNVNISSSDETAGKVTVTPAKDTYEYGDELTIVAEANEGYAFSGWSDGNMDGAERTLVIDGDTTIVAIFVPRTDTKYIVRYMLQNIEDDEFTVVEERNLQGTTGAEVEPEVIELEGFTAPAVQKASIKADGSLIIEYRYIRNRYVLTWDADGGILVGEFTRDSVKFGTPIIAPEAPTKEGFLFIGWNIAIPATMPAEDVTIVAQWEKDDQGIEIVVEGGTIISNEEIHIYDFNGHDVTGWNGHLGSGLYIVVGGGSVQKIIIR